MIETIKDRSSRWRGFGDISGRYWSYVKRNAGIRKIDFDMDIEYAWDIYLQQNGMCIYFGMDIEFGENTTASLDRVDSENGYVCGNIQWVHKDVNQVKGSMSDEEVKDICGMILEYSPLLAELSCRQVA